MKQVVLEVEEKKYKFFLELIKSFDFIKIKQESAAKKKALFHISKGMQEAILADKGKMKSKSAKSFLNEL